MYLVYSGLNESPLRCVGQVRYFDATSGEFDIKPDRNFHFSDYVESHL